MGKQRRDNSGYSVSLSSDGTTVAIGADGNDASGDDAGHVRVYNLVNANAPVASNVSAATVKNTDATIHLVASDGDFDALTYTIVSDASNGTTSITGDTVTYTPTTDFVGTDSFTFSASDGASDSTTKTVTITVIGGYKTTQIQIGTDIDGEVAGDNSGKSVSFNEDHTIMAIGATLNDASGDAAGHVRVYKFNGTAWTKLGGDINGEAAGDNSGQSVSLSSDGTTLAIGAPYNDETGDSAGHVRVYKYNGTAWTQLGADINGEAASDYSGQSVSLSSNGTTLAIGAYLNDASGDAAGHVRVYKFNGTAWTKLGEDIDGEALGDWSGYSVSLSSDGTTVAIGAFKNDASGSNAGHVRVYKYNGTAWTKLGGDINGEAADDQSGHSVSLSSDGTIVAIGAYLNDASGDAAGHVRVYKYNGTAWTKLGEDIDGEAAGDRFGATVSLSSDGTIVAIGASGNDDSGDAAGHVRVYKYNGTAWTQLGEDIDGEAAGDYSSSGSVSLSSDGTALAIGAYGNDGTASNAGHVRVYNLVNANAPVAVDDTLTVDEDAALSSTDVIANDTDADIGDTLSLTAATTAGTGTVAVNADGLSVDYTPATDFNGTETITYTVSDGTLTDETGTLTITVTAVNDAPVAVDDTLTVLEDAETTSIDVIANDTDGDADTLSLTAATTAGTGTVAVNADGLSVDYTPATDFNGTETITYTVSDGTLTDETGTLTITVTAVDDAPVAVDDTLTVLEDAETTSIDVIANDTDDDGDGCLDSSDAFPLDPSECSDNDGDGLGDNADPDDDNDGILDTIDNCLYTPNADQLDTDADGTGNACDSDDDNDGFSDADEITCGTDPLLASSKPLDTDNDGIANCIDTDDDNDGFSDQDEIACGSDSLDATSTPLDTDSDFIPNCVDTDDDNDGYLDESDAFPLDATEWLDTDADGIGNNADTDDDGDGQLDTDEIACGSDPLLASSMSLDSDGDTIPNCVDTDDDNDGVIDTADAFP